MTDEQILREHPDLTMADLESAWDYARRNPDEIERSLWLNEVSVVQHDGANVPGSLLLRGRELGFSDQEIREAFEPVLDQQVLEAAWREVERRNVLGA
jgi:uncharacterized protein (DUF433 family)